MNIALTTLRPRVIGVNVTARHVWVDASVVVADLLAHLASYVTADAPAGWTLPAFPWVRGWQGLQASWQGRAGAGRGGEGQGGAGRAWQGLPPAAHEL